MRRQSVKAGRRAGEGVTEMEEEGGLSLNLSAYNSGSLFLIALSSQGQAILCRAADIYN